MTQQTVNPGVTSWTVILVRCRECGKPGPSIDKQPGASVRITYRCANRGCRVEQRQTV